MTEAELAEEERLERDEALDELGTPVDLTAGHRLSSEDDGAPPARILTRSDPRASTFGSRLSTAIRRSLRLGPKRSTTAGDLPLTPVKRHFHPPTTAELLADEDDISRRVGKYFTTFADVKVEPCEKAYGTISELQRLLQLARHNPIKKFVRNNNWPTGHEVRGELWKELCRNRNFEANKQLYRKEVDELLNRGGVKTVRAEFLSSDDLVSHDFGLRESGAVALQRLMIVIERVRPEITYVPLLYPLSAIFLHYVSEEETFACMLHLLRGGDHSISFLQQSRVSAIAVPYTLLALIKKHKNAVYNMVRRRAGTSEDLELVKAFRDWRSWIFRCLPFEYAVRVVDCFLVEGHKMLLRVAVALVYVWSKDRGAKQKSTYVGKSVPERVDWLSKQLAETASSCPVSVQTLLDAAAGIRNLKGSTILRFQKHFEEIARLEEDKRKQTVAALPSPPRKPSRFLYTKPFESCIVNAEVATEIMCSLPNRFQLETPQLLFRLTELGTSFTQLYARIDEADQTLFVFAAVSGEVFGAYCSASWAERKDRHERSRSRYFGTGESFVWRLDPELGLPIVYGWVGDGAEQPDSCPQMFMAADERSLIIGSGGGDAIAIRDELYRGLSSASSTFDSPALVRDREFVIRELEVFAVQSGNA